MKMRMNGERARVTVGRGQILALPDADGTRLTCLTGVLWITQDRDLNDVVLLGGQSMRISSNGATRPPAAPPNGG